jgi:putative DNA primase/helicase
MNVVPFADRRKIEALPLAFSISENDPGNVVNVEWTWAQFLARLGQPHKSKLTYKAYKDLDTRKQAREKSKGGYFVGAQFRNGIRRTTNIERRVLITFDLDAPTPELVRKLKAGITGLCDNGPIEYAMYSTFSHTEKSPKYRVVVPLSESISNDRFAAVARITGQLMDPEMLCIDRVSFTDAQFMYWPAHLADVTPELIHHKGKLLDPDAVLNGYGEDWKDFAKLPKSPKEGDLRQSGEKVQDPTLKQNIVGAWCRNFTIHDVISEFLSDVYEPSQVNAITGEIERYTYKPGTGVNGAIYYPDGHLYSQHGSDPVSNRNVNAWDLYQAHEYGHLDMDTPNSVPMVERPSYKKMVEFANTIKAVRDDLLKTRYPIDPETAGDAFEVDDDAIGAVPPPADMAPGEDDDNIKVDDTSDDDWQAALDVTSEGIVKSTLPNIVLILSHAFPLKGVFGYNEFTDDEVLLKQLSSVPLKLKVSGPTHANPTPRVSTQAKVAARMILEAKRETGTPGWGLKVSDRDLDAAITKVCADNRVHPIKDYLRSVKWDGVKRCDQLWIKACHTPDTPYYREAARIWLTAAVARIYQPGCKFDSAVIIEGMQGTMKSTLLSTLGGWRWTTQMEGHFDSIPKFVEATKGFWIVELPELGGFGRAEVNSIKATMSRTVDTCRLAYKKDVMDYKRQGVMAGTTNDGEYFRDTTGNRRFWPIPCGPGPIDIEWVKRNRDQIWAEAAHEYREMVKRSHNMEHLPLFLQGDDVIAEAKAFQDSRLIFDGSADVGGQIEAWLDTEVPYELSKCGAASDAGADVTSKYDPDIDPGFKRNMTCAREIWLMALNRDEKSYNASVAQSVVSRAMKHLPGWRVAKNPQHCGIYGKQRVYVRTGSDEDWRK